MTCLRLIGSTIFAMRDKQKGKGFGMASELSGTAMGKNLLECSKRIKLQGKGLTTV